MIGRRQLELDALLQAGTRVFVVVSKGMTDEQSANVIIAALPKILTILTEHKIPFIAKIHRDHSVELWKTKGMNRKGIQSKGRRK
jgi:hypothetical protein